jgi:hypothetical protein
VKVTGPADGGDEWVGLADFAVLASDWLKSNSTARSAGVLRLIGFDFNISEF